MNLVELTKPCSNIYLVGSQMYGLNVPGSDEDFLQIYFDKEDYIRPFPLYPDELQTDNNNYKLYSLEKFARLVVKGNPNIVEVIYETPFQKNSDTVSDFMSTVRPHAIHKGLGQAFMGHLSAILVEIAKKGLTPKRASHAVRVMHSLEYLLKNKDMVPYRELEGKGYALAIKRGEVSVESAYDYLNAHIPSLEILYNESLHELPDATVLKGVINSFFKDTYRV